MSDRHIFWSDIHLVLRMVQKYKFEERFFSCVIMVYPFICERVNHYTVNFVVILTTSATYGKMFLDRKGCGRRWIEALKERGYGWRLRVVCDWQQK